MPIGTHLLVVDDSRFMIDVFARMLKPHFNTISTATSYQAAQRELQAKRDIDLVLCDAVLADGNAFQFLEQIASANSPKPRVLVTARRWVDDDWHRAIALGAIGYLPRPVSLREIRQSLSMQRVPTPRDTRRRTLARALLIDPEQRDQLVACDIHNASSTGALIDTGGPLPTGTELEFEVVDGADQSVRTRATVVRSQEPSWLSPGGVGVRFDWMESPQRLTRLIGQPK
jgi:CheY-like chemotaxis protein